MSVTVVNFPTSLQEVIDSKTCGLVYEDKTLRTELEGGYAATRAKHTKLSRRTFKFGLTEINHQLISDLDLFYRYTTAGGSILFNFITPWTYRLPTANQEKIVVRFTKPPDVNYMGVGLTERWTVTCEVEEV